jgi:hypothetical protein
MVFSAVMTANLFNGLNTSFWSGWVFFAVFIGIVLVWVYTVSESTDNRTASLHSGRYLGCLRHYLTWMVRHPSVRKQHFPLPFCHFLVLSSLNHRTRSRSSLPCKSLEIHRGSWRYRYHAMASQGWPAQQELCSRRILKGRPARTTTSNAAGICPSQSLFSTNIHWVYGVCNCCSHYIQASSESVNGFCTIC